MNSTNEKPRIHVKSKYLQQVLDFCIERKTEFAVIPRHSNDDWEIELSIKSIREAIEWGMFMKTNKIELIESPLMLSPEHTVNVKKKATKPKNVKKSSEIQEPVKLQTIIEEKQETEVNTKKHTQKEFHPDVIPFKESKKTSDELF